MTVGMKERIRKQMIEKRKNLSISEVLEKSNLIKKRLFNINNFKKAQNILFYVSYNNEVYTHDMIKECLSGKKKVIVPITNKKHRKLILSELNKWEDLKLGAYNILEPRKEYIKEIPPDQVDLAIVPGIAFDLSGNRIGHGMGYYDRLLKELYKYNISAVGLAFEFQIINRIPSELHDVKVKKIVTEKQIISCVF